MAIIQKTLFAENLDRYNTFVQDTDTNSKYFKVTELPDTFTGGKNAFLIQGSEYLVADTLIKIELKDASGNTIYHEPGEGIISSSLSGEEFISEYYEGVSKVVAVYIYPETAYGPCTLTILGELSEYDNNGLRSPVPLNWQGQYNVKWQKQINVNPSLANTTKIRFYKRPTAAINELVSPIYTIDSNTGNKISSGINQSFADIKLSQMETFAGDVKRIKVFRTSLGDISDYDMVQDILVESKEELTSYNLSGSVVGNAGLFTSEVLEKLWTDTIGMYTTLDSSKIDNGVKLYSTNANAKFAYTSSLNLSAKSVYEFGIDVFYSSSLANNTLNIYISGSNNGEVLIGTLNGITPTKNLKDQIIPFSLDKSEPSASLYLQTSVGDYEIKPYEWHIGNVSLKLSQDTAFSPDSVSFITSMPMVVGNQDYNFKFEFYDINNNYVPVAVTQSANFTGGSNTITKLLTFESDRTAFRFSTGSFANPPNQNVRFKTIKTNFTGSVTYASSAFDVGGTYIQPASYAGTYPGAFVSQNDNGALLNISSFSGSVASVLVGSIVYTASCEGFTEFETIYRFEDGDNAPGVFVTANTNQFIYKATDLSLNPIGQIITIEAKRKNLASATTPLTVNSGSGKPPLTLVSTNATNGVDTYTIAGSSYPFSTSETIYFISGSDQFGNEFSDAIKITPVKILDGLSATLTNDNASLPALSNGFVASGSFILTSGSVTVKVGNESISFDDDNDSSRANNTFAITNLSGTGCTPNGGNNSNPSTNSYSITNLTEDSGSLDITISYKDGAGDTTSIVKTATYTKNKKAAPVLTFVVGNNNQSTDAKSTGEQITSFGDSTLSVKEQYNGSTSTLTLSTAPTINSSSAFAGITKTTSNLTYPTLATVTDSVELSITGSVTDSEGVSRNVFGNVSLTKIKKAAPVLAISSTNRIQSVSAKSTGAQIDAFSNVTISVNETYNGSTTSKSLTSLTATSSDISSIVTDYTTGVITLNGRTLADGTNSTTISVTAVVTDSEGVSRTITDTISVSKTKKAAPTITFAVTPASQTVAANSSGTLTGTISDPVLTAFEGTSALTYNQGTLSTSQYKITNVTGVTVASTAPSTSTIDVTGVSSTDNTGVVTIAYVDSEGTSGTSTIRFTISKAVQGVDGGPGADGKRTATGMIFYQITAASQPSTPTAASYTFSSNSFGSLTSNWAVGAPTYTAGNSNKYWYSTYTAVETTAGGGTAVPTFSAPAQAINFTGLVTFTSANNISDGSNTSNIVTPGAVANHIGGANVTTIEGGKISTGVITSTGYTLPSGDTLASGTFTNAGTIFNLDNGSLRSKNFYIASNGDSVFKGTMQIGGTNLDATNTLNANTTATQVGLGNVSNLTPQNQAQTGLIAGTTITGGGITLNGGGNIKGGQTDYNTGTGFFLGYHGSAYKFSIGNASTKGITWDGNTLSIGGDVNIGATLASTVVSNASTALSNAATAQTTATNAGTAASNAATAASNAATAASNAQTTADAKVAPSQVLSHIGGTNITTISGGKVTTGQIKSGNHGGTADGSTFSSTGTSIDLDTGGISAKNFHITTAGAAFFKGDITGASGTFGGSVSIGSGNSIFKADGNGIYLGNATFGSAPFRVTPAGALTATGVNISGDITATGGTFGGWTIDGNQLKSNSNAIILDGGANTIKMSVDGLVRFNLNTDNTLPTPNVTGGGTLSIGASSAAFQGAGSQQYNSNTFTATNSVLCTFAIQFTNTSAAAEYGGSGTSTLDATYRIRNITTGNIVGTPILLGSAVAQGGDNSYSIGSVSGGGVYQGYSLLANANASIEVTLQNGHSYRAELYFAYSTPTVGTPTNGDSSYVAINFSAVTVNIAVQVATVVINSGGFLSAVNAGKYLRMSNSTTDAVNIEGGIKWDKVDGRPGYVARAWVVALFSNRTNNYLSATIKASGNVLAVGRNNIGYNNIAFTSALPKGNIGGYGDYDTMGAIFASGLRRYSGTGASTGEYQVDIACNPHWGGGSSVMVYTYDNDKNTLENVNLLNVVVFA